MKDIGLVLVQHTPLAAHEPLISGVEHGLEEILVRSDMRLVTRVVRDLDSELDVYRYWHATNAVEAVVLVRLTRQDRRVTFLNQLKVPFVAIADQSQIGDFSAVTIDNTGMMRSVVDYLTARGKVKIAYVSGPEDVELSSIRVQAFLAESTDGRFEASVIRAEQSNDGGASATREALSNERGRPTAIIYDDDVAAATGVETITALGLAIPEDVAIVAWNDSVRCQGAIPPITAMSNEAHRIGVLTARALIETMGSGARVVQAADPSFIVDRASA
jgi:DNA-binding LacI/PurR family transcriptional regulator